MASTGLYWSYREPYKAVVYGVLDGSPAPPPKPSSKKDETTPRQTALPYAAMLARVTAEHPQPGLITIVFPKQGESTVSVSKTRSAGFWCLPIKDEWSFQSSTGDVVARKPFAGKTRAEKLLSLMLAIHTGAAWGNLTLVLWLLATCLGVTLPITGTIMWWNRMRGQWRARKILAQRHDGGRPAKINKLLQPS